MDENRESNILSGQGVIPTEVWPDDDAEVIYFKRKATAWRISSESRDNRG